MNKVSEIISTPVISLYEGEYIGIIYNIIFDYKQKKCNYACVLDEKDNIPQIIKFKDIYKIGSQCVFIKNKSFLNLFTNCEKELETCGNPINLKVYNLNCEYVGTSHDVIIDDNFRMDKIILNNGKILEKDEVFNIGKSTIIIGQNNISVQKLKPITKSIKIQNKEKKVMILSDYIKKDTPTPQSNKIITDFRFLIGRVLSQDIIALNGEMIARKNSVVTKDIVSKASLYGKLVEIARYSKS